MASVRTTIKRLRRGCVTLTVRRVVYFRLMLVVMTGVLALTTTLFLARGLKRFPDTMCLLYANLTVRLEQVNNVTWVRPVFEHNAWGPVSLCQFVTFLHVSIFINAHVWLWIFLEVDPVLQETCRAGPVTSESSVRLCAIHGSRLRARQKYSVSSGTSAPHTCPVASRKGAIFLLPFFLTHLVLLGATSLSIIFTTSGLAAFCTNLINNSKLNVTCEYVDAMKWSLARSPDKIPLLYAALQQGTAVSWLTLLCLLAQLLATLAQADIAMNELCPPASVSPASAARRLSSRLPSPEMSDILLARADILLERTPSGASGVASKGDKTRETSGP